MKIAVYGLTKILARGRLEGPTHNAQGSGMGARHTDLAHKGGGNLQTSNNNIVTLYLERRKNVVFVMLTVTNCKSLKHRCTQICTTEKNKLQLDRQTTARKIEGENIRST
eukprot:683661-Amphidinium_carterae.1